MDTNDIEKAIEVAKRVTLRRNINFTPVEEKVFRKIFEITSGERIQLGLASITDGEII